MASPSIVLGIPQQILNLVQEGLLERAFHDALYPALMYRAEAMAEEWPEHAGTSILMTRRGLLPVSVSPLQAGTDPTPQAVAYEQWAAILNRYAWTDDVHMPTSATAAADLLMSTIQAIGLQGAQSVNHLARNALFKAYLAGQTTLTVAAIAADTSIQVSAINGFIDVLNKGVQTQPVPVSAATPLSITINGTIVRNVIQAIPNDPNDPTGPGILVLSAAVGGAGAPQRSSVISSAAPKIIRTSGGTSVDAITGSSTLVLQNIIDGVSYLRKQNVRPHEDGYYHVHFSNDGNSQVFTDTRFTQALTALPDSAYYQDLALGKIAASAFYDNNESPELSNCGATTSTGANASLYSNEISAETVNDTGVKIARAIITGRGALYERSLNEDAYLTEAGTTGKVGDFSITNAGVQIVSDNIRLILRAPLNRTQDVVGVTATISTSFPVPSDVTSGTNTARSKRAVVIEHCSTI